MILFILNLLPFILSAFLGILTIHWLDHDKEIPASLKILLGTGLGLGVSSFVTFSGFLFFDQFNRAFILIIHSILLIILFKASSITFKELLSWIHVLKNIIVRNYSFLIILLICLIPTLYTTSLYPNGGWDAWTVWNFKARTLFLGQEHWTNIFHPAIWRSSPHYPLCLPLINVWGWIFSSTPTQTAPIITSILLTTLTLGLLFYSLKDRIPFFFNSLIVITFSFSSIFHKFASSQYADIAVAFYLFASIYCLIKTKTQNNEVFALLSGIFLGILSFTKNEGLMASLIIMLFAIPYFSWRHPLNKKNIIFFFIGAIISLIPFIIFQIFYAPENFTHINGFTSLTKPSDINRLKAIFLFYFLQIRGLAGNGLWIVLLIGLGLGNKRLFEPKLIIIPFFLLSYGGILTLYYFSNTYFEVVWWMSQTLLRVLFSLLPIILYAIGTSLFPSNADAPKN